jgi:hypothetical protein
VKQSLKLVLYGLAVLLVLAAIVRMLGSPATSGEDGETEALVSRLIANDPLIAPVSARQNNVTAPATAAP